MVDFLKCEEEIWWLKNWLAIRVTKVMLQGFVLREIEAFHENLKRSKLACTTVSCSSTSGTHQIDSSYQHHLETNIERQNRCPKPWRNCDRSKWCCSSWEIAKSFIYAPGYKDHATAEDTDLNGILHVILNFKPFQNYFSFSLADLDDTNLCHQVGFIFINNVHNVRHLHKHCAMRKTNQNKIKTNHTR